jgi:K+/H+ antiporter YhaU regulatory subunit KhtT
VTVVAIQTSEDTVATLPPADRPIEPGDQPHAIGRPDDLRRLKAQPGSRVLDPLR